MYEFFLHIIKDVESLRYYGIFIVTFIEGTLVPIPSELLLIPAGYFIANNQLHLWAVLFCSITGTMSGVLLNYYIALHYGRKILTKYGKYLLLTPAKIEKVEFFFQKYGQISIFWGRMLPGVKHFIAFPAGLCRMNIKFFLIYSALGGTIWVSILLAVGYFIGNNQDLIKEYVYEINKVLILVAAVFSFLYILYLRYNCSSNSKKNK